MNIGEKFQNVYIHTFRHIKPFIGIKMRKKLGMIGANITDIVAEMSEGNPGAINVMMMILRDDPQFGFMTLLNLDDMNIWGPQIWIGFKDYANSDLTKFIAALKERKQEMVDCINKEYEGKERAVTSGASFKRE